jgi:hypothetical protein
MFMQPTTAFADARRVISRPDAIGTVLPPLGLTAGMQVETPQGWRAVETIVAGDRIQTMDGGMRQVIGTTHTVLTARDLLRARAAGETPLYVPGGALDTCAGFHLMPGQPVLIDSHHAEAVFGNPLVLVPGAALEGWQGILPDTPEAPLTTVRLMFDEEEVIYANTGALLHCPTEAKVWQAEDSRAGGFFTRLSLDAARLLIDLMRMDDAAGSPRVAA